MNAKFAWILLGIVLFSLASCSKAFTAGAKRPDIIGKRIFSRRNQVDSAINEQVCDGNYMDNSLVFNPFNLDLCYLAGSNC